MHEPFVQGMLALTAATFAYALLFAQWGIPRESRFFAGLAGAWLVLALVALALIDATPPDRPGLLHDCEQIGAVQMVRVDGWWACVPPGQEG